MLETELFAFLEDTTEAIFAVQEQDGICFWNHAAQTLFGYKSEEVLGKNCFAILQGVDSLGTQVCRDRLSILKCPKRQSDIPNFDLSVTTFDGRRLWINLSTLIYRNGRTGKCLMVHLARDISAQKKQEELVHRMAALSKEISLVAEGATGAAPVSTLSTHEVRILRMFAAGESSSVVVKKLHITPQTLRNHFHHINRKLRTHNRLEAVTHASLRKLI
jgi:PAS domain S-box-containing protein